MLTYAALEFGECLAISATDISADKQFLRIKNTTTLDKSGKVKLGEDTKTPSGDRTIVINEFLKPVIESALAKMKPNKDNLLFAKDDGKPYTDSALNSSLKRICQKAGIKCRVHNHKLRKNFNTRGVEAGVDYKVLEQNAGHADIHVLLDTYVDTQKEFKEKEMNKYVNYIKQIV